MAGPSSGCSGGYAVQRSLIHTVPQTGSTNSDLSERLRAGEAVGEGTWLVANRQTNGRGRLGRVWSDGLGNFMGSTVVRPAECDPLPPSLAFVAALAVYEAVVPLITQPDELSLKWPNDLLISGAKLAGILLEREGNAIIVGIGVNLASAPELPDRPTASLAQFGPRPDRDLFAQSLAASFDKELDRWRSFGLDLILRRWEAAAHPRGTALTVQPPGERAIPGNYDGLTDGGALKLRLADNSCRVIHAGDVILARKEV